MRRRHYALVLRSVTAEVKSVLFFPQRDGASEDASAFTPADPEHFGVTVQVFIGDTSSDAADSFDLIVCSPSWFAAAVEHGQWERFQIGGPRSLPENVAVGAGMWFMRSWNETDLRNALTAVCEAASPGPDWGTIANRIGRVIPWEYDYKYDSHVDAHFGETLPPPL